MLLSSARPVLSNFRNAATHRIPLNVASCLVSSPSMSRRDFFTVQNNQTHPNRIPKSARSVSIASENFVPTDFVAPSTDFNNGQLAFESKSTYEIVRALGVFRLSALKPFVKNARFLLNLSERVLGHQMHTTILKKTFFGHFCAGENETELLPVVDRLRNLGVGAILDYAAEGDIGELHGDIEAICDAQVDTFLSCIRTTGLRPEGFSAIKLTALSDTTVLQHVSSILMRLRFVFENFTGESFSETATMTKEQFMAGAQHMTPSADVSALEQQFSLLDSDADGHVSYLDWMDYFGVDADKSSVLFPENYGIGLDGQIVEKLSVEEKEKLSKAISRVGVLAQEAYKLQVRLMIDAEHSYFQPAIDFIAQTVMSSYNQTFPTVYNTYQCYLKDSIKRMSVDMQRCQRDGTQFGAKLVRGAYMVMERKRAATLGYEDPIWATLDDTHACYDAAVSKVIAAPDAEVMIASHNEKSIISALNVMARLQMAPRNSGVYFGQLLGMSDHVSMLLGSNGYRAFKYVPYGPVDDVIPYLVRRAEENSDLLGGAQKERKMLFAELQRRVVGSQERLTAA